MLSVMIVGMLYRNMCDYQADNMASSALKLAHEDITALDALESYAVDFPKKILSQ
jgi:hypothetical protein